MSPKSFAEWKEWYVRNEDCLCIWPECRIKWSSCVSRRRRKLYFLVDLIEQKPIWLWHIKWEHVVCEICRIKWNKEHLRSTNYSSRGCIDRISSGNQSFTREIIQKCCWSTPDLWENHNRGTIVIIESEFKLLKDIVCSSSGSITRKIWSR